MSRPDLFPALRYRNAPAALDFLVEGFGFTRQLVVPGPAGSIAHAQAVLGTGVVLLSSDLGPRDGQPWSTVPAGIYARVPDPDAHCARAVAAGAEIALPLATMDYGAREYSVRDCEGHLWAFGSYDPAPDGPPDLFPALRYTDGRRAIAWLQTAFGFTAERVIPGPDDTVAHAELRLATGVLMLGSTPASADSNPWADARQGTCIALADVDGHCERARAAGARILLAPHDTPYGARSYTALDPEGHLWTFSTYRP